MQTANWSADEARAFLGGMKSVATVRGSRPLEPLAAEMLEAVRRHILHTDTDIESIAEVPAGQLASTIQSDQRRHEFVQFLILMPYLPMQVDPAQVGVVDEIAKELGLNPRTLTDLHQVRDNRLKRLALDFERRSLNEFAGANTTLEQIKALLRTFRQFLGDSSVAARFRTLDALPAGSLGHTLFHFYRERSFPLPGEKKSFSEYLVAHDCCHILGGFNTDMNGEMNVAGFEAGLYGNDFGFELLLEIILDFHMGKTFTTAGLLPPGTGHFDPEDVLIGYERGVACNVNLIQDWDFWQVADRQITELRAEYGVPELPGPILLPPPEAMETPPSHEHD